MFYPSQRVVVRNDKYIKYSGVFMYPHNREISNDTMCSVYLVKERRIENVLISSLEYYNNNCWNCKEYVYGSKNPVCPKCHWVICPQCGACSRIKGGECSDDNIVIFDVNFPDYCEDWDFVDYYFNDGEHFFDYGYNRYNLVAKSSTEQLAVEAEANKLIVEGVKVIIVASPSLEISVYTINEFKKDHSNRNIYFDNEGEFEGENSGCVFCGRPRAFLDIYCEDCANNID